MKKRVLLLAMIVVICLTAMGVLFVRARNSQRTEMTFSRRIDKAPHQSAALDLGSDNVYVAGFNGATIYLGSRNPYEILSSNRILSNLNVAALNITTEKQIKASQIMIDSTAISVIDLYTSHIYEGNIPDFTLRPFNATGKFLTEALRISARSFVTRTWKIDAKEFCIAKEYRDSPDLDRAPELLQSQVDGAFSTDGMLHFSKQMNRLIYLYYYRNEYIVFDTTLSLTYRGNTVDTIQHARITVANDESKGSISLSSPALVVNKKSAVEDTLLYVNSTVIGMDEDETEFYKSSVVDVYDLTRGSYISSFYIPRYRTIPMKSFAVSGGSLFAVHGQYLVRYDLNSFTASFTTADQKL